MRLDEHDHDSARRGRSARRHPARFLAPVVLAASLLTQACGATTPSASPTAASPPASPASAPSDPLPAGSPPPASPPVTVPPIPDEPSVPGNAYHDVGVTLEMSVDCGFCGPEGWLGELPEFRLYADGLAVFRTADGDSATAPYRFLQLDDPDVEALIHHALDEGGLRGAAPRYPDNADDVSTIRFTLYAPFIDAAADVHVQFSPIVGGGTVDVFGNPLEDLDRRERLEAFAALLSDFDAWLAANGASSDPFVPDGYTAALVEPFEGDASAPWPWNDVLPDAFGAAEFDRVLARITPDQAAAAGLGPGGGSLATRAIGDGRAATLLVRPLLPGDDRPGSFGLRPDVAAVTVEGDLRVRSLPEVSDASIKYEPLLDRGDALYLIDGPVAGSGYAWYEVHAPRTGLTGWVAAAAKTGEAWIAAAPLPCTLAASPDEIVRKLGYDLMHLACYGGTELSGQYVLARPEGDGLRCPDVLEWWHEPDWIDVPLACTYDFGPVEPDTGFSDLPSTGVLHPSIANVPEELLDASPGGLLVEVAGQLDHPDTRTCTATGDPALSLAELRLGCRMTFVITEIRPAS